MSEKKNTTISDIAEELDINISTVSRALKDHPGISDATKEKVIKTAKKLNYYPNSIASALARGKTNVIGVIVPSTGENFFASVIKGIEKTAKDNGYKILISQSNDSISDEEDNIKTLLETHVDGILASLAMETRRFEHYQKIIDKNIPLVLFDRYDEALEADVVAIDDYLGAYRAVEHLIKQGCEEIAHFSGLKHVKIYSERLRGYKQALEDNGIAYNPDLVFESNMKLEQGRELAEQLLERDTLPDAIFCASDHVAMGAMQTLKGNDIEIPGQVALVGFSNEAFASFVTPSLTSVEQYSTRMGRIASDLFLKQVGDKEEGETVPQKIVLTPKLMIRESSLRKGI
ncbi:LacI family transcriptional regulator [Aliifodinibius sp. S!AR15-10]|uniref:LacI family DNA-binding transcriptional regulator n=1 Tax=Aliifodinibius sp. S!AR15-10 TaxID=2950437 RepID=UPI00285F47BB|nr:LacI family DNA-binding transcriptional regulator [Aliifodinibius sp. S!AR15-10]MDR8393347.1 LacI family transcriptional regulator [Aliifodinibius sp. S!AR15-10]